MQPSLWSLYEIHFLAFVLSLRVLYGFSMPSSSVHQLGPACKGLQIATGSRYWIFFVKYWHRKDRERKKKEIYDDQGGIDHGGAKLQAVLGVWVEMLCYGRGQLLQPGVPLQGAQQRGR